MPEKYTPTVTVLHYTKASYYISGHVNAGYMQAFMYQNKIMIDHQLIRFCVCIDKGLK